MKIADEATRDNSIFSLNDRIGLLQDAFALARAGLLKLSSALSIVLMWKHEKECTIRFVSTHAAPSDVALPADFVWRVVGANITMLLSIWWENPNIVGRLNELRRVSFINWLYEK
jgi:aminopeptidase 2